MVTYNLGFDFGKKGKVYLGQTSCGGGRAEILPQGILAGPRLGREGMNAMLHTDGT
jgi:hypothetical protein